MLESLNVNALKSVALRKESVDRNAAPACAPSANGASLSARRAWIEMLLLTLTVRNCSSLSARRAWIEMSLLVKYRWMDSVALRKESVDRNITLMKLSTATGKSLSARRAWIEMAVTGSLTTASRVALRKESVDRNFVSRYSAVLAFCRSPQGERG